uniref:Uncharacterized protein n=1 Tax=Chromera velia CCMP2878 TaxID=1169474 RepID=A0A0G4I3W8_9ALVE|eukprot:Cvel_10786.t1-p1 / transcript=Cvel_10786.t1 / gene=Cvel_10786 / organism=Chromera_velia_CCMP2878 / gene_product=hypothetical protein / transcript_product=hypothetical protein / location=Cvel_scaffold659:39584-44417(+) / protein_length=560 / sequence_SO=supercontig / SO=protein_coding / is_pseudo=false
MEENGQTFLTHDPEVSIVNLLRNGYESLTDYIDTLSQNANPEVTKRFLTDSICIPRFLDALFFYFTYPTYSEDLSDERRHRHRKLHVIGGTLLLKLLPVDQVVRRRLVGCPAFRRAVLENTENMEITPQRTMDSLRLFNLVRDALLFIRPKKPYWRGARNGVGPVKAFRAMLLTARYPDKQFKGIETPDVGPISFVMNMHYWRRLLGPAALHRTVIEMFADGKCEDEAVWFYKLMRDAELLKEIPKYVQLPHYRKEGSTEEVLKDFNTREKHEYLLSIFLLCPKVLLLAASPAELKRLGKLAKRLKDLGDPPDKQFIDRSLLEFLLDRENQKQTQDLKETVGTLFSIAQDNLLSENFLDRRAGTGAQSAECQRVAWKGPNGHKHRCRLLKNFCLPLLKGERPLSVTKDEFEATLSAQKEEAKEKKVKEWAGNVERVTTAAEFASHEAYAACSKSLQHEWKFVARVVPGVGGQMGQLEGMIRDRLIPALMKGRRNEGPPIQHDVWLRDVAALPVRLLGLGIPKPTKTADRDYKTSAAASEAITEVILRGENIDADEHVKRG